MSDNGKEVKVRYKLSCDQPDNLTTYALQLGLKYAELGGGPDVSDPQAHAAWHEITEGRDGVNSGVRYGWCGDQVTNILFRGGVRTHWLNRVEMNGKWAPGMNVIWMERLFMEVAAIRRNVKATDLIPGDIFTISNPDHIGIVIAVNPNSIDTLDGNGPGRISVCQRRALVDASSVVGSQGARKLIWAGQISKLEPLVSGPRVPVNMIPSMGTSSTFRAVRLVHGLEGDANTEYR